jgi:hypothetical protein
MNKQRQINFLDWKDQGTVFPEETSGEHSYGWE